MMTASTSSTFCVDATPAPSASTARVDQVARELVALVERARPDAAGQPRAAALLHDLEQDGLLALSCAWRARASIAARPA